MWAVEAKTFGPNPERYCLYGLTQRESRIKHNELSNSGKWAMVRSWDLEAEAEKRAAAERIKNWIPDL